ncbi:MAG: hypothetical protein UMU75_01210 [Halomonas sp.]|nr:hypothetical protein [Halomonas sp.]
MNMLGKNTLSPLLATVLLMAGREGLAQPLQSDAETLRDQAALAMLEGIGQDDPERIEQALELTERLLAASPEDVSALLTQTQLNMYRHRYREALASLERALPHAPDDGTLRLTRCMLVEQTRGETAGQACYRETERQHAALHESSEPVGFPWVGAAILGETPNAEALTDAYLERVRRDGGIERFDLARQSIESLESGRYVQDVLMMPEQRSVL